MSMTRADKKTWAQAQNLADLGELTARYLQGGLTGCPGHPDRLDDETRAIAAHLAALNRAGYVTDNSQPGYDGPGFRGHWRQKAAVTGSAAPADADRIQRAARSAGLDIATEQRHIVVTEWNGRPHTGFGGRMTRRDLKSIWPDISSSAFREIENARHFAIVAPEWGPSGDRIWPILARAIR